MTVVNLPQLDSLSLDAAHDAQSVYLCLRLLLCCLHPVIEKWFLADAYTRERNILDYVYS